LRGELAIDPRGRWIAVAGDRGVIILDPNLQVLRILESPPAVVILAIAASPDGSLLISGRTDKNVTFGDPSKGKKLKVLSGHTDYVRTLAFSGDGQTVVSGSADKSIKIWSTASGALRNTLVSDSEVQTVVLSGDGRFIASAGEDLQVKLWDAVSGKLVKIWKTNGALRTIEIETKSYGGRYDPSDLRELNPTIHKVVRMVRSYSA
jgi:WD40 repeat protein